MLVSCFITFLLPNRTESRSLIPLLRCLFCSLTCSLVPDFFFSSNISSTLPQHKISSFARRVLMVLALRSRFVRSERKKCCKTSDHEESWNVSCSSSLLLYPSFSGVRNSLLFSILGFSRFSDSFIHEIECDELSVDGTCMLSVCWLWDDKRDLEYAAIETSYDFEDAKQARRANERFFDLFMLHTYCFVCCCWLELWKNERKVNKRKNEMRIFFCLRYLRNLSGTEVGWKRFTAAKWMTFLVSFFCSCDSSCCIRRARRLEDDMEKFQEVENIFVSHSSTVHPFIIQAVISWTAKKNELCAT